MKNKNFKDFENPMDALAAFTEVMRTPGFSSFFGGMPFTEDDKHPYERLGDGYELRPIELTEKESKDQHTVNSNYCHLYHNDLKVSDLIFRKGGMGGKFKDGYCALINYVRTDEKGKNNDGFSFGKHVIVNHLGEICLLATDTITYPSHCGGNLGKMKDTYYDLRTGKELISCSTSGSIDGKGFVFVQHRYDWYNKQLPLGVYKINKITCEYEKIDEIV